MEPYRRVLDSFALFSLISRGLSDTDHSLGRLGKAKVLPRLSLLAIKASLGLSKLALPNSDAQVRYTVINTKAIQGRSALATIGSELQSEVPTVMATSYELARDGSHNANDDFQSS